MRLFFSRFFSIGRSGWESYLAKIVEEEKEKAATELQLHFENVHLLLLLMTDCEAQAINIVVYIIPANESSIGTTYAECRGVTAHINKWL